MELEHTILLSIWLCRADRARPGCTYMPRRINQPGQIDAETERPARADRGWGIRRKSEFSREVQRWARKTKDEGTTSAAAGAPFFLRRRVRSTGETRGAHARPHARTRA
jgi:hypothetical protein